MTPLTAPLHGTASRPLVTLARRLFLPAWWLLGVMSLVPNPAQAQAVTYRLDPAHTRVYWEVMHFGTSTSRGRFDDITGSLQNDPAAGTGEVSISVGTASVNTGVAPLDGILRSTYFASREQPRAFFVASGWRWRVGEPLEVRGEFTLRGVSRPLVLRGDALRCAVNPMLAREVCGADLSADLQRSDFGINDGLPFIGNKVRLLISVEAVRE